MAILSTGELVPCCFDYEAVINLGSLKEESLASLLEKPRAKNMLEGFKKGHIVEELCKHCSYRTKF
jgi:radical SAM protein with 4Fe4S-binding SPASM domain